MKLPALPKKNSVFEKWLSNAVAASPLLVTVHFFYRASSNAYPPEADSIGIPIFTYWIFVWPMFLTIAIRGREGLDCVPRHIFWNPQRNWTSLLWTILPLYPGLYVLFLFLDAASGWVIPSMLYSLFLGVALFVYRAGGISRPRPQKATTESGLPAVNHGS